MRHLLHLNDTVFFCFVLSFWGGGWEKGYLFLNTEILHWHTIVRVFDQMNYVFSQLLASDLWIKMWKISMCMKEKHHTIESVWAICIHSLQCIKDSLVFFFFFFWCIATCELKLFLRTFHGIISFILKLKACIFYSARNINFNVTFQPMF